MTNIIYRHTERSEVSVLRSKRLSAGAVLFSFLWYGKAILHPNATEGLSVPIYVLSDT